MARTWSSGNPDRIPLASDATVYGGSCKLGHKSAKCCVGNFVGLLPPPDWQTAVSIASAALDSPHFSLGILFLISLRIAVRLTIRIAQNSALDVIDFRLSQGIMGLHPRLCRFSILAISWESSFCIPGHSRPASRTFQVPLWREPAPSKAQPQEVAAHTSFDSRSG